MSNKLMIRYESDDLTHWSWVSLDEDNRPFGDVVNGDLPALAEDAGEKKLVLVVAARSLLITVVDLPAGNVRTVSSAIPYAMEEQIADDVEHMHFAQGKRRPDGNIPVIAISKQLLTQLLLKLADVGLYPTWAVAEPLLLPWRERELAVCVRENRAIVRDGELSGYECTLNQLPTLLECTSSDRDDLETIRVWSKDEHDQIGSMFDVAEEKLVIDRTTTDLACLTGLGQKLPQIDILQGFDAPKALQSTTVTWRPAIALCLAAALLYLGTSVYHYFSLQQEIKAVTQQTEQLFRETFPDVKRLVQPLVQAQQKLDQRLADNGRAADDLLDLLLALGEARQNNKSIQFKNLEYRQKSLVVHLVGNSVAQIERLKQQLETNGATNTNILSTVSKEGRVEARIKIEVRST